MYLQKTSGVISNIVADEIGIAAMLLGAGRATKEDEIDLAVGLMLRKVGDAVKEGEPFVTIYANRENVEDVKAKFMRTSLSLKQQWLLN